MTTPQHSQATDAAAGSVAIVTGAARGIGYGIARMLGERGYSVVLADILEAEVAQAAQQLASTGVRAIGVRCDVRSPSEVESLLDAAYREFGHADCLVNNAAVIFNVPTPFLDVTVENFDRAMETNVRGVFLCSQRFAKRAIAAGRPGVIINISSASSEVARPNNLQYQASKAAINQMSRVIAIELAPYGFRVCVVAPGVVMTERETASMSDPVKQVQRRAQMDRIPLGRTGGVEEIASVVAFLASPEASYMTGAVLFVDGGYSLGIAKFT
ncbi:MAG TPA: SDR family oxidoreductase [bacterium]|nr:SDR family oxidoreductase [bacterium]